MILNSKADFVVVAGEGGEEEWGREQEGGIGGGGMWKGREFISNSLGDSHITTPAMLIRGSIKISVCHPTFILPGSPL